MSSLRARIREEDGIALASVLAVMLASLALATAAAVATVGSLSGTNRESDSKAALTAADTGLNQALIRQNVIAGGDPTTNACLEEGTDGFLFWQRPEVDGWCAAVEGSIAGSTYSYRTKPSTDGTMLIASTGTSDGVNRRLLASTVNSGGSGTFADASLIGKEWLNLESNTIAWTGVASDGWINLKATGVGKICGTASTGIGGTLTIKGVEQTGTTHSGGGDCSGAPTNPPYGYSPIRPVALPAVQQGDVQTVNDNCRISVLIGGAPCADSTAVDVIGGKPSNVRWSGNGLTERELELKPNTSLTLGGGNYSFCRLVLNSNSTLFIAAGATARIFFDSPENCNQSDRVTQIELNSNSQIATTSSDPTSLAILFVGSDQLETNAQLNSNLQPNESCQNDFIIYAPKTKIDINSNVKFCGAIAGLTVNLAANVEISSTDSVQDFQVPGAGPHYTVERLIECSATAGAEPDSSC